jgi:2-dehydropantoate 2-reductase
MRVCVFGAGAIGGHLAARLAAGGAQVSVVARGPHLAAIRAHGLREVRPDGEYLARIAASDNAHALGPQDAVIATVKAPALASLAASIHPLLGPDTPVAFVMNGIPWWYFHAHGGAEDGRRLERIDPGGAVWQSVGPDRAIGGVVHAPCTVTAPGVVAVEAERTTVVLGEPDGTMSARLQRIGDALAAGGVHVETVANIRDRVWAKLLGNLATAPVSVLGGGGASTIYADPACAAISLQLMREGIAIANALGRDPGVVPERLLAGFRHRAHKPSILQDLEAGRPMEVDAILTVPQELARAAGVPTPALDLLLPLVRLRARLAGLYAG